MRFQFLTLKNIGVSYYEEGQYKKAIYYLQSALDLRYTDFQLGIDQANLYLLKTYNKLKDTNKAKIYVDRIDSNIPEIDYLYTAREMHAALSDYYQQIGNHQLALQYAEKEMQKRKQIDAENKSVEFLQAEKDFYIAQQTENNQKARVSIYIYIIVISVAVIIILLSMLAIYRQNRKNKREVDKYAEEYSSLKTDILSTREEYLRLNEDLSELRKIDKKKH